MKQTAYICIALSLVCALASPSLAGSATGVNKAKAAREAACKKEATAKRFGIHLIQKRTFMKECVARTA